MSLIPIHSICLQPKMANNWSPWKRITGALDICRVAATSHWRMEFLAQKMKYQNLLQIIETVALQAVPLKSNGILGITPSSMLYVLIFILYTFLYHQSIPIEIQGHRLSFYFVLITFTIMSIKR